MQIYTHTLQVERSDLDELDHVNNVRYVQWIQDIAKAHWQSEAPESLKSRYFWVVLKHIIEYKSAAVLYDYINIKTFVKEASGVTSTRIVEMYHAENDSLILKSETIWCLMDARSKRPTRISNDIANLFK